MKTTSQKKDLYSCTRLPEIIIWIIGLLVFIVLFFRFDLNAQPTYLYLPDTIILSNNDVIPCFINKKSLKKENVNINYTIDGRNFVFGQYPKEQIVYAVSGEDVLLAKGFYRKQIPRRVKFYVGIGFGIPRTTGITAAVVFKNDIGVGISFKTYSRQPKGSPDDWSAGPDVINVASACFIKEFYMSNPLFRFGLEAGPSLVKHQTAYHTRNYGIRITDYSTTYVSHPYVLGLAMKGRVTFSVSRTFGLELALSGNLNKNMCAGAIELYFLFGRINDRKKR